MFVFTFFFSGDTYECIFCGIRAGIINNEHALANPSGDSHDIGHVNCYKCLEYGFCDRRMIPKSNFWPHTHTYVCAYMWNIISVFDTAKWWNPWWKYKCAACCILRMMRWGFSKETIARWDSVLVNASTGKRAWISFHAV